MPIPVPTLERSPGIPTTLRIRFREGERPHEFWVSAWTSEEGGRARYKILSKRRASGEVEALVVREAAPGGRIAVGRVRIPPDTPDGWMGRWLDALGADLGVRFERIAVPGIASLEDWQEWARQNGWSRSGSRAGGTPSGRPGLR